jgi:hypothetical protein
MKQCTKCKKWKSKSEFHKHKQARDGLKPRCKECRNEARRQHWHTQKYDQGWHAKVVKGRRKRYQEKVKNPSYREHRRRYQNKHRRENGYYREPLIRQKAKKAVEVAVRYGELPKIGTQQCHECEAQANHYHHHKGYDKEHWLVVIPLCARCHGRTWRQVA